METSRCGVGGKIAAIVTVNNARSMCYLHHVMTNSTEIKRPDSVISTIGPLVTRDPAASKHWCAGYLCSAIDDTRVCIEWQEQAPTSMLPLETRTIAA